MFGNGWPIDTVVVGSNQHSIEIRKLLWIPGDRSAASKMGVFACFRNRGNVGVIVLERSSAGAEQIHKHERGTLARIVYVLFVSDANDQHAGTGKRLTLSLAQGIA